MSETLDEENNIQAYCKETVIKVIKFNYFFYDKEIHSENSGCTKKWR